MTLRPFSDYVDENGRFYIKDVWEIRGVGEGFEPDMGEEEIFFTDGLHDFVLLTSEDGMCCYSLSNSTNPNLVGKGLVVDLTDAVIPKQFMDEHRSEVKLVRRIRRRFLETLSQVAWISDATAKWTEEGWTPDPNCHECGGRGWGWADPLLPLNTSLQPSACACSFPK